jgi:hypothetical protein
MLSKYLSQIQKWSNEALYLYNGSVEISKMTVKMCFDLKVHLDSVHALCDVKATDALEMNSSTIVLEYILESLYSHTLILTVNRQSQYRR